MTNEMLGTVAFIQATWHSELVDRARQGFVSEFGSDVDTYEVPGAFEIPIVTAKLARRKRRRPEAIICLGVILRGETTHADNVSETVSRLLGEIAVETSVPVIHEVLLLKNKTQAKARCVLKKTNRGVEAAHSALAMARLIGGVS